MSIRETVADNGRDDGLDPPPPLLRKPCAKPGCRRPSRQGGRYCRPCATAATRAWRDRHRADVAAREQARTFDGAVLGLRRARAYVAALVRRGKLTPGPCELCGDQDVVPAWNDPAQPRAVRWFCRSHRDERKATAREIAEAREALRIEAEALEAELALLPPDRQAAIRARADDASAKVSDKVRRLFYWRTVRDEMRRASPDGFFS